MLSVGKESQMDFTCAWTLTVEPLHLQNCFPPCSTKSTSKGNALNSAHSLLAQAHSLPWRSCPQQQVLGSSPARSCAERRCGTQRSACGESSSHRKPNRKAGQSTQQATACTETPHLCTLSRELPFLYTKSDVRITV